VRLRSFGDSALQYELLCWVNDPVLRGRATHELNTEVYKALRATDIEIPFPQRVVSFGDEQSPEAPLSHGEGVPEAVDD